MFTSVMYLLHYYLLAEFFTSAIKKYVCVDENKSGHYICGRTCNMNA